MIATRPANTKVPIADRTTTMELEAGRSRSRLALVVSVTLRLVLLACAGVLIEIGWIATWTLSYRLTHGNEFTYTYLTTQPAIWSKLMDLLQLGNTLVPGMEQPGFEGPASLELVVNPLVMAFILAGIGYLAAVLLIDHGVSAVRGAVLVVVVFELIYQVTLFLTPGVFTTDIFSYVMYGNISALYNLNPYIYPPNYFPSNPMLGWIHPIWHDQPSVYGPIWTNLSWLMARAMAPLNDVVTTLDDGTVLQVGLMDQVFAYKALMNVVQVINLALVWWLLGRVFAARPRARLTAFVVFAWNPLMLFDVPGSAHNDALMVTLLLLGVAPLVGVRSRESGVGKDGLNPDSRIPNPAWALGTFFVGMSALIKYTTGLVGLFYIVPWAQRLPNWRSRVLWIGGVGVLTAVVSFVLFLPWLEFPRAFEPLLTAASGKPWMFTNWAPDLIALTIDRVLDPSTVDDPNAWHEGVRFWAKLGARVVFLIYLGWELARLWRRTRDRSVSVVEPVLESSARAFVMTNLVLQTWVMEWYWMWPLAIVTLLGWRRMLTKVVVGYTLTALPVFYAHHYWSTNMPGVLVLAYALPPLALPLIAWAWDRWSPRTAQPDASASPALLPGLGTAAE
jgi:alpha-1,6-mannosyltransferase